MKISLSGFAAFLVASLFSLNVVTAAPLAQVGATDGLLETLSVKQEANPNIVKVYGCHKNKKFHMVYKWGYKAWHRHGYNCHPKHVVKKKKWGHCHKNWSKHWHNGHGNNWHRHAGPGCHYQWGKSHHHNKHHYNKNKGCVKVGPVWICP